MGGGGGAIMKLANNAEQVHGGPHVTLRLCSPHCFLCCPLQGTCRNDVCVCTPGYSGTYCEVPPACGVILDVNGNCCNHGVVSSAGVCCGPVSLQV